MKKIKKKSIVLVLHWAFLNDMWRIFIGHATRYPFGES